MWKHIFVSLQTSTDPGSVQVVPRPDRQSPAEAGRDPGGPKGGNSLGAPTTNKAADPLCQRGKKGPQHHTAAEISPVTQLGLEPEGGPGSTAQVANRDHRYQPSTGHHSLVCHSPAVILAELKAPLQGVCGSIYKALPEESGGHWPHTQKGPESSYATTHWVNLPKLQQHLKCFQFEGAV